MSKLTQHSSWVTFILAMSLMVGACSKSGKEQSTTTAEDNNPSIIALNNLPLLAPQVRGVTPSGLLNDASLQLMNMSSLEIKNRFFSGGPTDILGILSTIDERIKGINARSQAQQPSCLSQEPVAYSLDVFGQAVEFYGQCFELYSGSTPNNPSMVQFATVNGATYLYFSIGQQRVAAIATPVPGAMDKYSVKAWIGIGYLNETSCGDSASFDGCSYGAIQLETDASNETFEMAVAGIGFGYCGAQLKSNGKHIFVTGSVDSQGCQATETMCVAAADLTQADGCADLQEFNVPALGRDVASGSAEHEASKYPAAPNVILSGESTDSLNFGPLEPTANVGDFMEGVSSN